MARTRNPLAGKGDDRKPRESAFELIARRRRNYGVDWADVDNISLKAAIASCIQGDVAVMFTGAAGGTGVCLTIWVDGQRYKQYANSSEELSELLDALTDTYGSGSEDIRATVRGVEFVQGKPSES